MKNFKKLFGIIVFIAVIVLSMAGCDMENRGYQTYYYEITAATYNSRPTGTGVSYDEHLSYVKNAAGTKSGQKHWSAGIDNTREYLSDKMGIVSNLDEIISWIEGQYVTVFYKAPGFLNFGKPYMFFYIENNNLK
jgi:hypothetical protein